MLLLRVCLSLRMIVLFTGMIVLVGCAPAAHESSPVWELSFRQWYGMPVTRKQTYLEETIPRLDMHYEGGIAEIANSLDELYLSCDRDCRNQDMHAILENLQIMYTLK